MKPGSQNLWWSLCLSVGVHVTAAAVLQHWGANAERAAGTRHADATLAVIVLDPAPALVAKVATAPVSPPAPVAAPAKSPPAPTPAAVAPAPRVAEMRPKPRLESPPQPASAPAPMRVASPTPRVAATKPPVNPSFPAAPPMDLTTTAPALASIPTAPATLTAVSLPTAKTSPNTTATTVAGPSAPVVAPPPTRAAEPKNVAGNERAGVGQFTISLPEYRSNPAPVYPDSARRKRQEGVVWLMVEVGEQGEPRAVAVERTSGHAALDEAAVTAVRGWKFAPARQGERPVAARVEVPVRFQLGN